MKRQILSSVLLLSVAVALTAHAMPNPSAIYCVELGYQYETWTDPDGSQYGVCIFPDGSHCNAWDFFNKCYLGKSECDCHWPCTELPCKQAGQTIIVGECCPGLTQIPNAMTFDEHCNPIGIGGAAPVCSDCGNGICENWESTCNCPLDCGFLKTIYVDDDATGANNGTSWVNAYKYLQDALADANSAPKPVEIRVAQGVYTPDRSTAKPNGTASRDASFVLAGDVCLFGGFPPGGAVSEDRDPSTYETVLSGDLSGNDLADIPAANLLTNWSRADNSYNVVTVGTTDQMTVLDGFTITGGNADGSGEHRSGGGIRGAHGNDEVRIHNCAVTTNAAALYGGGIHGCDGPIINCIISGNRAHKGGGLAGCGPISSCTIIGNMAEWGGGGLFACEAITLCTIRHNVAGWAGGGLFDCDGSIGYCSISGNTAGNEGGGLAICNGLISDCAITDNSAHVNGGGLWSCHGLINNCTFMRNEAGEGGGGLRGGGTITNCTISGNKAGEDGGGLMGCGQIGNCTIVGNAAGDKGGALAFCSSAISNCIIWSNRQAGDSQLISSSKVQFSCVQGNWPGISILDADPCFVNPGQWTDANDPNMPADSNDLQAVWTDGDYHLRSKGWRWDTQRNRWTYDTTTSPCIDAGDPAAPLGDEPLAVPEDPNNIYGRNLRINMGAYGGTAEASMAPHDWALRTDYTNDGTVNSTDFACWSYALLPKTIISGDLDRNGAADPDDLSVLSEDWLSQTSWFDGPLPMGSLPSPSGDGTAR